MVEKANVKIERFAYCPTGINNFKANNQWQNGAVEPKSGAIIFFDWDGDGVSDHMGIVEKFERNTVHTIEGNSGDMIARRNYKKNSPYILGLGVDVKGSIIFSDYSKERFIPGIGSNRKSKILNIDDINGFELVSEIEAIKTCHELVSRYSLVLGGSSGAVYLGVKNYLLKHPEIKNKKILCIFADGGYKYMDTIYIDL